VRRSRRTVASLFRGIFQLSVKSLPCTNWCCLRACVRPGFESRLSQYVACMIPGGGPILLKPAIHLNTGQHFSPYLTGNTLPLRYNAQPVNVVWGNRRCLLFEPYGKHTLCGQNAVYINSVRTSQETHDVSATKPNRLMLFGKTVAVYYENHTEHTVTCTPRC
jgi:hypothetical protein